MNKVFLAVVVAVMGTLASLMAAPVKNVTVDHSSKEAIADSFLKATAYEDGEALWSTFIPIKLKSQEDIQRIKQNSIKNYFSCCASCRADLRKKIGTPEWKKIVDGYVKENNKYIVKIDGRWYIDIWGMMRQRMSRFEIPPCPEFVDHSSRNSLAFSYILGIYYENDELVWNCYPPEYRNSVAQQNGGKAPKGFARNKKQRMSQNALVASIKVFVSGAINNENSPFPAKMFVKVNGKWYIAP